MLPIGSIVAGTLAVQSVGISLWQHFCAARFPFRRGNPDLPPDFAFPSITVLKPLKGCDAHILASLESWMSQDYPGELEILFGVASSSDPAFEAVTALLQRHPGVRAQLIVCPPGEASNPKVSTLIQLSRRATGRVITVSDADVRVPSNLLRHAAATLSEPGVGLAHCFYRLASPKGLGMRLEAVGVNADFWAQVSQARSLGMVDFALGAVMTVPRDVLEEIGGFARIAHFLADDYQLGNLVSKTGRRIELCRTVVECFSAPSSWRDVWKHQLRWTRTVRICKPGPFLMSILGNATLWPLLFLAVCGFPVTGVAAFALWMAVRILLAQSRVRRLSGEGHAPTDAALVPLQDLMQAALWATAHFGSSVSWQGRTYRVMPGGRMVPADAGENGVLQPSTR